MFSTKKQKEIRRRKRKKLEILARIFTPVYSLQKQLSSGSSDPPVSTRDATFCEQFGTLHSEPDHTRLVEGVSR